GIGLVEIGPLQFVVERIERRARLDLLALAHIEFHHAAGFVRTDENEIGLDPALITGGRFLAAAGKRQGQTNGRERDPGQPDNTHDLPPSKIRSRCAFNMPFTSSGAYGLKSFSQIRLSIAGATTS